MSVWRPGLNEAGPSRATSALLEDASAGIGLSEHRFWAHRRDRLLVASGGGINDTFTNSGAALRVSGKTLLLSLVAVGRGRRLRPLPAVPPTASGNRTIYRHGSDVELYRNGPFGLEQAFVVGQQPSAGAGPLVLAVRLAGSLTSRQVGSQVLFGSASGGALLRYGGLNAVDADGRRLSAQIHLSDEMLWLRIDDRNARYPLRIDPLVQQGRKLVGAGEVGEGEFGESVALSSGGTTALIGAPRDDNGVGAAWVFTRSGEVWTQQGEKLTAPSGGDFFGSGVALSADGNTALVGSEGESAAWVFTRSEGVWMPQGEKLSVPASGLGMSISLSADGDTALIGAAGANDFSGAAWVFTRQGASWTQQGEALTSGDGDAFAAFGTSVSVSPDGTTMLVGAPFDNDRDGAAWVFTRSGESWAQQAELTGSAATSEGQFGDSVALSYDGQLAWVGGAADGAAWVFARSGESWTQQGERLSASAAVRGAFFGSGVALSADGETALVAAPVEPGAAWVFTRPEQTWVQGEELTGGEELGYSRFGSSVALSFDGHLALVGGSSDAGDVGAAWIFAVYRPPNVTTVGASSVDWDDTRLNGVVTPNRLSTTAYFQYGPTAAYGQATTPVPVTGAEGSAPVQAQVGGLQPSTVYHFRIVATSAAGTSYGADEEFTTAAFPAAREALATTTTRGTLLPSRRPVVRATPNHRRVQSSLAWRFSWAARYTVVDSLVVNGVPFAGAVEILCHGRGCPFAHRRISGSTARRHCPRRGCGGLGKVDLTRLVEGRRLGVGARVEVNVVRAGWVGKSFTIDVLADRKPRVQISCLVPGSSRPGRGC